MTSNIADLGLLQTVLTEFELADAEFGLLAPVKDLVRRLLTHLLAYRGLALRPIRDVPSGYLLAEDTVAAARRARLSVCEYVEQLWDQAGDTQRVIERMAAEGIFEHPTPRVVEIGPGTGRYLEKVLERCRPASYEIYEIDPGWKAWLQKTYPIHAHTADGHSLEQTPDRSVDLLHAHGVFVSLRLWTAYRYFLEIWRVTKSGGYVAFDIMSDHCLDETTVHRWLESGQTYPVFLSRDYVVSLFERRGFTLIARFQTRYGPGRSEYLIFRSAAASC